MNLFKPNKIKKMKKQSEMLLFFSFISILYCSVYTPSCFAQILYAKKDALPEGWTAGQNLFETQFQAILVPIHFEIDSNAKPTSISGWLEVNDGKFVLSLNGVPRNAEQNSLMAVHELTHALHISYRPHEEKWVQEGVALLSEYLALHKESALEKTAYESLETTLTPDSESMNKESHQDPTMFALYGQLRLFFKFLYKSCGERETLYKLISLQSELSGIPFINLVLSQMDHAHLPNYCKNFDDLFVEFEIRKYTQTPTRGLDLSPYRGVISDDRAPHLEPYTAQAYYLIGDSKCQSTDIAIDANACMQIRTK